MMYYHAKASDLLFIFPIGAAGYSLLEVLWRGYTHWTMSLTGGLCFCLIYLISCGLHKGSVPLKCIYGACAVTCVEFIVGCVVNLLFHMNVWDYSSLPLHLFGQICLPYSILWLLLCLPLYFLCRALARGIRRLEHSV